MRKTYESIYKQENGQEMIIARGSDKDFVIKVAKWGQFFPFEVREYQTIDDIKYDYHNWRKKNGNKKPNRVIVKMHWEDDEETQLIDTIGIVPLWKIGFTENVAGDAMILFYVSSLDGLISLMQPNNGSDFVVEEVLEFYKM